MKSDNPGPARGPVLTMAQMRFAREHGARPMSARAGGDNVLFCCDYQGGSSRWLVNGGGEVLDVTYLARGGAGGRQRGASSGEPAGETS